MSDSAATAVGDVRRVLVVGDAAALEATIDALASAYDPTAVIRAESVATAHDRLAETAIDCLVCAFDSERDDAVLRALAAEIDAVPIVAVTDADDQQAALEAGATDVLEPDASDQVVATRIGNAAAQSTDEGDERDRRYRSILASAATVVWVLESDGTITDASPSVERRLGYTPAELEGTPLSQLVHPDDREDVRATIAAASAASLGARERQTCRLGRGDGAWTVVDLTTVNRLEDPHVEGIVTTVADVTTAEQADADRRPALDRLEEPVLSLGPSSELRYVNDAGERLFDDEPEPGTVVWNALAESIREPLYERIREATATGSPVRFGTSVPDGDGRLAVTVAPGDDGVTVLARELSAEAATANEDLLAVDRDRLSLLEGVVETLADGIAVLEGPTVTFANATLSEWHGDPLVGRDIKAVFDADLAETVAERADSTLVRWMDPIQGRLTAGPEPRPVDVFVAPLPDDDRTLCVVRDRRRSASGTLSTLHRTAADMRQATTRRAVRQHAVDGIADATDADYVGWYRQEEGQLRPAAITMADADEGVEAPPIAYEGTPLEDVLADEIGSVVERDDLGPVLSRAGIRAERVLALSIDADGIVLAASTDPFPDHRFESVAIETTVDAATLALEGLAARDRVRDCQREQERLEGRVEQADRLRAIEGDLLTADGRSLVEQRLCEGVISLAGTGTTAGDAIELAWIGRVEGGSVEPGAWAGPAESLAAQLESRAIPVDAEGALPTGRTAATHEPSSATDLEALADAMSVADPAERAVTDWIRELAEYGVASVVSVPIEYDGFQYGVLTVWTTRTDGLDEQTRVQCGHLSTVAGHAISSIQRTQALLAEVVTELEVAIGDGREPLSSIAARLDRRLDVRTVVPRSSGGSTVYCSIPDADAETLASIGDAIDGIESIRHVGDDADGSPVEIVLETTSVAETVAEHGGRVRSIVPESERTRLVIELSSTVEVRPFVRMLERTHSDATLLARREHDRSAQPRRAFVAELHDQLSERQLRTLETAYYSGFFEWPRESTGEEVAESLGVSQPTFSRHFRTAQRKLFELLFEDRLETDNGTVR